MDKKVKLRTLIWDKDEDVFSDAELEEFLSDAGGNVWRAAALCLKIVLADPYRAESYSRGRVTKTRNTLQKAITSYEELAGDYGIQTADVMKTYPEMKPRAARDVEQIYPGY